MGERVVKGACRGVVLLGHPVDAPSLGLVGERVRSLDEPAGNILAAPRLGDVEILQIAGWASRPRCGMHDQLGKPDQVVVLLGDESMHRRTRVAQRCPGSVGDFRRECGAVELEVAVPQRLPCLPVVVPYGSDDHVGDDGTCLGALAPAPGWRTLAGSTRICAVTTWQDPEVIKRLLTTPATWAVVGLSANTERTAYGIGRYLRDRLGMNIVPVNLRGEDALGERGYRRLADIADSVQVVDCFVNSQRVGAVVDEAIAEKDRLGIEAVWLQLGVIDEAAAQRAHAAGLDVVMDTCPAMQHPPSAAS